MNSDTLEARYEAWFAARDQAAQAHARSVRFEQACKRTERRIAAMRRDLKKLTGWQRWEREGELLSAHRHLMRRGMERVTVTDWYADDCAERVILLDPGRTPDENIEARFKRMRKAKKGMPLLEGRIAEAEKELNRLLREGPVALPEPADQAPFGGGKQEVAHFRRFRAADGWEVYVGRSATENDRLTFRFARGNDLWFHARDVPGSHVLLRGRGEAPQHVVLQAALLAAHFSRLKKEGGGEVMYTPRKYLKRPRGGSPGQVLVTQERVLDVGLETEALAQLLAARIP
ncbi:MAG: NFACT RNA binding domain-containing protein [Leptospirillia bacterium]